MRKRLWSIEDSNGSLCNSSPFAVEKKGNVYSLSLSLSTTERATPAFDVLPFRRFLPARESRRSRLSVGRNKSRLANTGRCELLLHSRAGSVRRHPSDAYLQRREVHYPGSRYYPASPPPAFTLHACPGGFLSLSPSPFPPFSLWCIEVVILARLES